MVYWNRESPGLLGLYVGPRKVAQAEAFRDVRVEDGVLRYLAVDREALVLGCVR